MVEIKEITKKFSSAKKNVVALNKITLKVEKGEFVLIKGESGSGKSTLLSIMGLMDTASSGQYTISDIDTSHLKVDQRTMIRNKHIGFVFQSFNLIDDMSVFDNVALILEHRKTPKSEIKERVERVLTQVDMLARQHYQPNQLSGGQQQRIAIARALILEPSFILLDEPTSALDSQKKTALMSLIRKLAVDRRVIMICHHLELIEPSDDVIEIANGEIVQNPSF